MAIHFKTVMTGLDPAIHVLLRIENMDGRVEQLSTISCCCEGFLVAHHGVEDCDHLAHGGDDGRFEGLSGLAYAFIE
ncbi:MAG: hypothetical protein IOC70_13630, partial [Methylocystis sp.]|nr:hypothetical protein [Methylocystis sp.]